MFHDLISLIRDPGAWLVYGYWMIGLIVFLETGALCFFLPGDSLLVVAGMYAAKGTVSILLLLAILTPAAVLGPIVSYWIGAKVGSRLFTRPRSRFFRPEHVKTAHDFYEKHGGKALVIARFMPIVRTFVPVAAGVAKMPYGRYTMWNLVGAPAWVFSLTLVGYFLGTQFPKMIEHIDLVIVVVVVASLVPGFISWMRSRKTVSKKVA